MKEYKWAGTGTLHLQDIVIKTVMKKIWTERKECICISTFLLSDTQNNMWEKFYMMKDTTKWKCYQWGESTCTNIKLLEIGAETAWQTPENLVQKWLLSGKMENAYLQERKHKCQ